MTATVETLCGVTVVRPVGTEALDCLSAARFRGDALGRLTPGSDVVVDLSSVAFVDSAGVGALVGFYRSARRSGCRVRFAAARPGVRSVLVLIRLDRIFDLAPDVESAVSAMQAEPAG